MIGRSHWEQLKGTGLKARALRGSGLTLLQFGGSNVLRLASNLILTRLLFPEAFGLMALVQVVMTGLQMFSDIGINTSIIQNKRGDDPDFLNTAWTIQIGRGVILWLVTCALAGPVANLYDEPMLLQLLPVVGFTAVITGFQTTKVATANRNLTIGRVTMVLLPAQTFGILVAVVFAYLLQSIWALVVGAMAATLVQVIVFHIVLPGIRNRLHWDKTAALQLIHFGKYIFLSTIAGFMINSSDRAVLGSYISLSDLGIYSIGFLLGTMPLLLSRALSNQVVFPLYRMATPAGGPQNQAKIARARRMMVGSTLAVCITLAFIGIPLVNLLYDPRYALAGPIVILFCLTRVPELAFGGYESALLAQGDSKRFFFLVALTATIHVSLMFYGVTNYGILGAVVAPGLAVLATHPLRIAFIRRYKAWDWKADCTFLTLGLTLSGLICWWHRDALSALLA